MTQNSSQLLTLSESETSNLLQHQQKIEELTEDIKSLVRQTAQNIIDIGNKLREIKQILGHGQFVKWLKTEFNWSLSTANKMMQASQQFKDVNLTNLNIAPSAIYLLAAPSIPDAIRSEAISRASKGQVISYSVAKALVDHHKSNQENNLEKNLAGQSRKNWKNDFELSQIVLTKAPNTHVIGFSCEKLPDFSNTSFQSQITSQVDPKFFQHYFIRECLRTTEKPKFLSLILYMIDDSSFKSPENSGLKIEIAKKKLGQIFYQVLKSPDNLFTDCGQYFLLLLSSTDQGEATRITKTIQSKIKALQIQISQVSQFSLNIRCFIYNPVSTQTLTWAELFKNLLQTEIS